MNKLSNYKTTIANCELTNLMNVTYQSTVIVKFNNAKVILNSGGYETVTTKRKMVQASNQFNLGYTVYQKDFKWFVETNQGTFDFIDNMTIIRSTGEVTYA